MTRSVFLGILTALASATTASAVGLVPVGHGFDRALYVAQAPGEQRLLVVTQTGVVRPITAKGTPGRPWLDIRDRVGSRGIEQGLLGLAFAPDFTFKHQHKGLGPAHAPQGIGKFQHRMVGF